MEDANTSPSPVGNPVVAVGLGVAGCLLGLIGLFVGLSGKNAAAKAKEDLDALVQKITQAEESLGGFDKKIADASRAANTSAERMVDLGRRLSALEQGVQQAINTLSTEVTKNREMIEAGRTARPAAAASSSSGSGGSTASNPPADGSYVIQSGDTFDKIAKKFGVSTTALMEANPDVEPRRMRVGQKLVIP